MYHYVNYFQDNIWIPLSWENSEIGSYLIGYLTEQILKDKEIIKIINKNTKWVKKK